MGKKLKVGKARKDKFYRLAKETGYRSRAAFKLIQLNRKHEFLQHSNVIIDLCAAPGGWLQVAAKNAPMSNIIIGVDIVPIPPIKNVITLQEDITTEKCRQSLKKELKTAKADCVLNDGAPNVGTNWIHDAYQQVELTLHALKLATEFLRKGGWFITKVFRSKDYNALMWVFQQMFKQVHATKPQASRNESAEIFVVCQNYIAPDKIDPKFLDPRYVFQDVDITPRPSIDLIHPEKKRRHREGYPEGDYTLFHSLPVTEFLASDDYMDLLAQSSEIALDSEEIKNHPFTTSEIKECLKDIKLLGKKDIRAIFAWRKRLLRDLEKKAAEQKGQEKNSEEEVSMDEDEVDQKEMEELENILEQRNKEELLALKKAKKKVLKQQTKQKVRIDLKMAIPGDEPVIQDDINLFNISTIKNKKELAEVEKGDLTYMDQNDIFDDSDEEHVPQKKREYFDKDTKRYHGVEGGESESEGEELEEEPSFDQGLGLEESEEESHVKENSNPLIIDMGETKKLHKNMTSNWFKREIFSNVDDDDDIELDFNAHAKKVKSKKVKLQDPIEDPGSASESEESSDETEAVNKYDPRIQLDAEGLAIGTAMVESRKRKREIVDAGYHRYMFNDTNLPDWFAQDERKHMKRPKLVTKEDIEEYKLKMKAIDAQPIKKIAEAKARKKRKLLKRQENARKKANAITDNVDVSEKEKWQQIKQIYKKAGLLDKKKASVTYVVAKQGAGKKVRRPAGVKGIFKVVDGRMKKDLRGKFKQESKGKKGKKGGKHKGR